MVRSAYALDKTLNFAGKATGDVKRADLSDLEMFQQKIYDTILLLMMVTALHLYFVSFPLDTLSAVPVR